MSANRNSNSFKFLSDGGEMGKRILDHDWTTSGLGDLGTWSLTLKTTLGILLNSRFPMLLYWGNDSLCFYNDAYRTLLGRDGKHPKILGMRAEEAWTERWDIIGKLINDVLLGGKPTYHEDQSIPIYRNGQLEDAYWTNSFSPVYDERGDRCGVFVTCTDTTEKVKASGHLDDSKRELEFAIESAKLGILDYNPKFGIFDYNPLTNRFSGNEKLREWFGLSAGQPIELTDATDAIVERDKQRVVDAIQWALDYRSGGAYDVQYTIRHPVSKHETIVHATGRARFDDQHKAYRFNGILKNITKQILSARKIKESEQKFQAAIKVVSGSLWTNDASGQMDGEQLGWNELTGQTYDEYQGFGWLDAIHPDDLKATNIAWREAAKEILPFHFEHRVKVRDGTWREFSIHAIPILNEEGLLRQWVGLHTDVTEQKHG